MLLYDFTLSAECYAVRLLAALLDLPVETRWIDVYPGGGHRDAAFLAVSPRGVLPVLEDGATQLDDWIAILLHLARDYHRSGDWLPEEVAMAPWLETARALADTAGAARLHDGMGTPADIAACRAGAHRLLRGIEARLWWQECDGGQWLLAGERPSIADIALFPHVALCEEGGISRMDYPAVRRWIDRIRRLPGFVVTSGIFALPAMEAVA